MDRLQSVKYTVQSSHCVHAQEKQHGAHPNTYITSHTSTATEACPERTTRRHALVQNTIHHSGQSLALSACTPACPQARRLPHSMQSTAAASDMRLL